MSERIGPTSETMVDEETGETYAMMTFLVEETIGDVVIGFAVMTDAGIIEYPDFVASAWVMAEMGLREKVKEYDDELAATAAGQVARQDRVQDGDDGRVGLPQRELRSDRADDDVRRVPDVDAAGDTAGRDGLVLDHGLEAT